MNKKFKLDTKDYAVLTVTTEASLHHLFKRVADTGVRFYLLKDRDSGMELGSIEVLSVTDNDLLVCNPGARKIN